MNDWKTDNKNSLGGTCLAAVRRMLAICLLLYVPSPWATALGGQEYACSEATLVNFDEARELHPDPRQDRRIFRIEVPEDGVLVLEVSSPAHGFVRPRIDFLGTDCSGVAPGELTYVERLPIRQLAKVRGPQSYFLGVSTAPVVRGGSYTLRADFSPEQPLARRRDPIPDPAPGEQGYRLTLLTDTPSTPPPPEDDDDDPVDRDTDILTGGNGDPKPATKAQSIGAGGRNDLSLTVTEPGILEFPSTGLLLRVAPGEYHLGLISSHNPGDDWRFYPICGLGGSDDHADGFTCASEIGPGAVVEGEIEGFRAADVDVFAFALSGRRRVIVESAGDTDIRGELVDERGALVADDDDGGEAANFRIVATLPSGRYFLRVTGVAGSQGPYLVGIAFVHRQSP